MAISISLPLHPTPAYPSPPIMRSKSDLPQAHPNEPAICCQAIDPRVQKNLACCPAHAGVIQGIACSITTTLKLASDGAGYSADWLPQLCPAATYSTRGL